MGDGVEAQHLGQLRGEEGRMKKGKEAWLVWLSG